MQDIIDDLEALRDLVGETLEKARAAQAKAVRNRDLEATHPSAAGNPHRHERETPLPPGRVRRSPAEPRWTGAERRAYAERVLLQCEHWVAPLWYAEQHFREAGPEVIHLYKSRLADEFRAMYREGVLVRRTTGRRGATYEYKLKPAVREQWESHRRLPDLRVVS